MRNPIFSGGGGKMYYKYNAETIKFSPYTSIISKPNNVPHVMDFWKITYAVNGSGVQITDGVSRTLTKNTVLIIKPGLMHVNLSYSDDSYRHRDIYVFDDDMRKICSYLPKNPYNDLCKETTFFEISLPSLENLEHTLSLFPVNSSVKNDYLSSLHVSVIINVLALYLEQKEPSYTKPQWLVTLVNNIHKKVYLQNNVAFLIKEVPYSHGHICREFKKYYHVTLTEYLTKSKIVYSNLLLMDKSLSVTEIAYSLGFTSQSAFIKSYKKYYQISPGAFRKKNLVNKNISTTSRWGKTEKNQH